MWAERITQKVKALGACLLDAGLRFIQGKSQSRDNPTRPIQRLGRFPATQDHEIVRIGDHMSLELLSPLGVPPTLQQTVDIQDSEQWAGHAPYTKGNFQFVRTIAFPQLQATKPCAAGNDTAESFFQFGQRSARDDHID